MAKTIKQFSFQIVKMHQGDDLPFDPIVVLELDNWSSEQGRPPRISNHLMSEGEIEDYIDALKADLDAVGARAKRALKKAKADTLRFVRERNSD